MPKFNSGNTDVAPFQALFIANELVSTAITLRGVVGLPCFSCQAWAEVHGGVW